MASFKEVRSSSLNVTDYYIIYEDMQAEVRIGGILSEYFRVRNGLHQKYTLAPTLFNLFVSTVVSTWRTDCVEVGVDVLSHPGR